MRIMVHDYAGHPLAAELSRHLALRGHAVAHVFFEGDVGPKGRNTHEAGDAAGLTFHPVAIAQTYSKANFRARRSGDLAYGRAVAKLIADQKPDIILSGNTPTEAQEFLVTAARSSGSAFIYWCQDFYSIAATRILTAKIPVLGGLIGGWYRFLERRQMHRAAHVIHITEGFCQQTDAWGISRDKVSVIPNWGALDQIPQSTRDNVWSKAQGLKSGSRYIYSGTLALKHNPQLLIDLARAAGADDEVIVIAAGVGVDALKSAASDLPALRILPLQPFDQLPNVLGAADILVAVIEEDAGQFSVPSKVLSYLCAGRPIVLAAPADNLAAQIVRNAGAGQVVAPTDAAGFVAAAQRFANDKSLRTKAGNAGRAYASATFDLPKIAEKIETIMVRCNANR